MDTLLKKNFPLLHRDKSLTELLRASDFNVIQRRNKNLDELLSPSLSPNIKSTNSNSIIRCNNCDVGKNYMVFENMFNCKVTDKIYFVESELHCNSCSAIYLVQRSNYKQQYIGSTLNFKQQYRIHKSDIKSNKVCCGTGRDFNNVCCHPSNPNFYLKLQLIEQVFCNDVVKAIL